MVRFWMPEVVMGDQRVDEQHRALFRETATFAESLVAGADPGETSAYLEVLAAHVREHFDDEEALMREVGFPGLAAHRLQHVEFAERVRRFSLQWRFQQEHLGSRDVPVLTTVVSVKLYQRVCDWLVKHIGTSDQQFARWARCERCDNRRARATWPPSAARPSPCALAGRHPLS